MQMPRSHTRIPDRTSPVSPVRFPMQLIISWIVETDRRFRVTQDQIDCMSDRF